MRPRILLALLALVFTIPAHSLEYDDESVDSCIAWFEGLRKQKYQWAAQEIATLNFVRSKLARIDDGMKKVALANSEVKKYCSENLNIDVCLERQDTSYATIKNLQTHLYLVQTSRSFQAALNKSSANAQVLRAGVEKLISDHQIKLSDFASSAEKSRLVIGAIKARSDFQKHLEALAVTDKANQLNVVCQLRPSILQKEFVLLEGSRNIAPNDPLILIGSHTQAKNLNLDILAIEEKCGRQPSLEVIRKKLQPLLSQDPYKKLPEAFAKACKALNSKEFKHICAQKEISEFTISALHSALRSRASK